MKRFLTFFLILSSTAFTQQPLTLAELIDLGLKNNPETEIAWANTKRAEAALGLAKSRRFPSVDAVVSGSQSRQAEYINGPYAVATNYGAEICLSYLLYDCGERNAEIAAMKQALLSAKWMRDSALQRVLFKVCESYYEYLNAEELFRVKESALKDAEWVLGAVKEMHTAGLKRAGDLSLSRAEIAQIRIDVAQRKAGMAIAYGKLLASLGLPYETKIEVETNPEARGLPREDAQQLIAIANERRADLLARRASLAGMQEIVKREDRAALPKLRMNGQGGWNRYSEHQGNFLSAFNYNVGLALDIPIFKGFEYTYRKQQALAQEEMTAAEVRELQDAIALEVLTYRESVEAAQEALKWSGEYLQESLQSYEGSLESYQAGLESIFDLIQSQRSLDAARMRKVQAKTQWLVSLAQLAFATGSILE